MSRPRKRLIPRWYAVVVVGGLALFTVLLVAVTAAFGEGVADMSMYGLATSSGLVLVAAVSSLVRPRRKRQPEVRADGARVFRAPALTVWPLVAAWVALTGTAAVWGWVALTDFEALASPGSSLATVIGAVGLLPDFVRMLTGRLHRWTLTLGPEELTYRGYRSDVSVPWRDVRGAEIQDRGPAGVRIDLRRARRKDPVVPITAFTVPAEQLVEEIDRARISARR